MTPKDESTPESPPAEEDALVAEVDRTALSAVLREVIATHFVVWTTNDGGGLKSAKVSVSEIAQQISSAARIMDRNFDQGMTMMKAASKGFDAAAQLWDSQVRQSEQELRAETSGGKLNEVKGLHNQIRTRVGPIKSLFRRVLQMLHDIEMSRLRQQHAADSPEAELETEDERQAKAQEIVPVVIPGGARLSEGFLQLFRQTPAKEKRSMLNQYFYASQLTVDFGEVEGKQDDVITPRPAAGGFYYLKEMDQLLRITEATDDVPLLVHFQGTDSSDEMSLATFAGQVQKGVWLLRPRPNPVSDV